MDKQRVAVIEAGTRSIRLLVCDVTENGIIQEMEHYPKSKDWYLGNAIDTDGQLTEDGLKRAADFLSQKMSVARQFSPDYITIIGTDVLRRAKNREILLYPYSNMCVIRVLQPEEEAHLSLIAVANAFRDELVLGQQVLIVDQGGGSTEIVSGCWNGKSGVSLQDWVSIPQGHINLTDQFVGSQNPPIEAFNELINTSKILAKEYLHLSLDGKPRAFGLGSVVSNLMAYGSKISPRKLHGKQLSLNEIDRRISSTIKFLEQRKLQLSKANQIPAFLKDLFQSGEGVENWLTVWGGAPLLREIMLHLGILNVTFCMFGLRYGAALAAGGAEPNAARILATSWF